MTRRFLLPLLGLLMGVQGVVLAEETPSPGAIAEKTLAQLSESSVSALGQRAMTIRPADWKHGETEHFIYHYVDPFVVGAVSTEAEFYYRVIAKELEKETARWERKCHVYIFGHDEDWQQFQKAASLEPWTGGIHSGGDLFIQRNPQRKFKGNSLAHEMTHLVLFRFFGSGIPLWLNEGLAEYSATRFYSAFMRSRGYNARPVSRSVSAENYIPVGKLTGMLSYPSETAEVIAFYAEAERLVRFLSAADKRGFLAFTEDMSRGSRFDSALEKSYGRKFFNLEALETAFKPYAEKDHDESAN